MKTKNQPLFPFAFMLFALMPYSGLTHWIAAQDSKQVRSIREAFVVVPAYYGCCPVEVTGIALTGYPLELILGQAMVENRSDKTVVAVKLGWRVDAHAHHRGIIKDVSQCGIPPADKAFLSGNTPLISMGQLGPKQTRNIGPNPLISQQGATETVFIDYPIISADDVKSLPLDETRKGPKYSIVLYVSEIHYADGTSWTFEDVHTTVSGDRPKPHNKRLQLTAR